MLAHININERQTSPLQAWHGMNSNENKKMKHQQNKSEARNNQNNQAEGKLAHQHGAWPRRICA